MSVTPRSRRQSQCKQMSFTLKAIAAASRDRVIGKNGDLPWRIPEDLKWFKRITSGHAIIMGRKTWKSLGRPLPNRRNLVLSRTMEAVEGMEVVRSLDELETKGLSGDVFIIGGGELYAQLLEKCEELYLTTVHREVPEGDVFFPEHEQLFDHMENLAETEDFILQRWVRKT
jgi:dihydrofolate reductase